MAVVLDASALLWALLDPSPQGRGLRARLTTDVCHAPHLIDAEIGNVLRRKALRNELAAQTGHDLLAAAAPLIDHRHPMTPPLSLGAWRLRENVTHYDALYVALAAALSVPLLTADARLRRAPALPCTVELVTGVHT